MTFENIEIEINKHCNRRCPYCPNGSFENQEPQFMKENIWNHLINQLAKNSFGGRLSYHFYNEPLLHPRLLDYVKDVRKKLPKVKQVIYSNGDYLDIETFQNFRKEKTDLFVITNHDAMQGKPNPFARTYQCLTQEEKQHVIYLDNRTLHLTNRGGILKNNNRIIPQNLSCNIPDYVMVIDMEGNVLPCFEDYRRTMKMGNIMDESLNEIWNHEEYVRFRERLRRGKRGEYSLCRECNNDSTQIEGSYDYVL